MTCVLTDCGHCIRAFVCRPLLALIPFEDKSVPSITFIWNSYDAAVPAFFNADTATLLPCQTLDTALCSLNYVPYVRSGSNIVFTCERTDVTVSLDVLYNAAKWSSLPLDAHDASLQQMCLLVFLTVMKRNFGTEPRDESYYWPWSLCSDFGCLGHDEQSAFGCPSRSLSTCRAKYTSLLFPNGKHKLQYGF